jgi:hypothetical protein
VEQVRPRTAVRRTRTSTVGWPGVYRLRMRSCGGGDSAGVGSHGTASTGWDDQCNDRSRRRASGAPGCARAAAWRQPPGSVQWQRRVGWSLAYHRSYALARNAKNGEQRTRSPQTLRVESIVGSGSAHECHRLRDVEVGIEKRNASPSSMPRE